jgi:hypothetical protein
MTWKTLLFVLVLTICPTSRANPLTCAPGTLQDYIDLGSGGCLIGTGFFYNFGDSSFFGLTPGSTEIVPESILVTPATGVNSARLVFQLNSMAGPGEVLQARIGYTVEFPSAVPLVVSVGMTGSAATGDGVTTVVKEICPGGEFFFFGFCFDPDTFDLLPTQAMILFDIGIDASVAESLRLAPVRRVGILDDIVIDGGYYGSARIDSAANEFTSVPEPGTFWSFPALVSCVWLGLRRRRQQ